MSPIIEYTKRDMNFGRVVDPAWYRVRIVSVSDGAPSKDKQSTNYQIEGEILFNGDNGDVTFAGVGLQGFSWFFNSKMMGPSVGLLKCFDVEVKDGTRVDLKAAEGQEVDVFVENSVFDGRVRNNVNHKYRKPKPEVVAVEKVTA